MDDVEKIRQKIDIVSLISEYIPLKKVGRNFKSPCPFHTEKTPSFVVSPERQIWHCFGCNRGGDVFTFLMEYEKLEFVESLKILAKKAGITLSNQNIKTDGLSRKKEVLYEINHLACEFYHYILTTHDRGKPGLKYLSERKITKNAIETFKLGFAPIIPDALIRFLVDKKGYDIKDLFEAGLAIAPQHSGQKPIDRFRGRIIFPLKDHRGNIAGFSGRVVSQDSNQAKYVNTPETLIYHKGDLLFGIDLAKEEIRKKNSAILVEGEFDVIQARQNDILNMVAVKGTAITEMQAQLLKRFTENVSICLDQDRAGIDAALRGIEIFEAKGLVVNIIELSAGKDPDESFRNDPKIFKQALKRETHIYDFLISTMLSRFPKDDSSGKKKISEAVLPFFLKIQNEIVKDHYVKKLATEISSSEESILKEMERLGKKAQVGFIRTQANLEVPNKKRDRMEVLLEYLLALILQSDSVPESFQKSASIIDVSFIENLVFQKIFLNLKEFLEKGEAFSIKEETALREVEEETGIVGKIVRELESVTYWYQFEGEKIRKTVYYFIMEYVSGSIDKHDFEMENVEWLKEDEVENRLTYKSDKEVWQKAKELI